MDTASVWSNRRRRIVTVGLLAALASPVLRNTDGVPLSTFPMYSGSRSNVLEFVAVSGIDPSGSTIPLSIRTIADTRDPLIAESYLRDAVRRDDSEGLCLDVASRTSPPVSHVEVRLETYDVVEHSRGGPPLSQQVLAVCEVLG